MNARMWYGYMVLKKNKTFLIYADELLDNVLQSWIQNPIL